MLQTGELRDIVDQFTRTSSRTRVFGSVSEVTASFYVIAGLSEFLKVGDCLEIGPHAVSSLAQVVRVTKDHAVAKSFETNAVVGLGSPVERIGSIEIAPDSSWLGRVVNAFGHAVDDGAPLQRGKRRHAVDNTPPKALRRARVENFAKTGVRAIDCFTPLCTGQRIGIFAGSGVGKSTLLSMIARSPGFDCTVVCLVGERGREVTDFLDGLTAEGVARCATVIATGDESPMMRRLAPLTAMTIAEHFRDEGSSVLLIIDSITRYAHALREVALAAGELPVAHGYTPSVFADLPRLLERAGPGSIGGGSVTGVFSVLVDADNHNDPIADCIRGTLDGHIVLDREVSESGRYPAIDLLKSISRLAHRVWTNEQKAFVQHIRGLISRYEETRDLRILGAYSPGQDPILDQAVSLTPFIYEALQQSPGSLPSANAIAEIADCLKLKIKT
jgi:flagellum-specific ATP synthase